MQVGNAIRARAIKTASGSPWRTFLTCESGGTAIEYGLIAALMTIALVAGLTQLSASNTSGWNNTAAAIAATMP